MSGLFWKRFHQAQAAFGRPTLPSEEVPLFVLYLRDLGDTWCESDMASSPYQEARQEMNSLTLYSSDSGS